MGDVCSRRRLHGREARLARRSETCLRGENASEVSPARSGQVADHIDAVIKGLTKKPA